MIGYLLDTNVISEPKRATPDEDVAALLFKSHLSVPTSALSLLKYGLASNFWSDAAKRSDLNRWLNKRLRPMVHGRELPITEDILLTSRLIIGEGRKRGDTFPHPDILMAASAAHDGVTVVTRNTREFITGVDVIPWLDQATRS